MPTRYEDIVAIAREPATFSSRSIYVLPPSPGYGPETAPPVTSDPPDHRWQRQIISSLFAPQVIDGYEQGTSDICNMLIDGFISGGTAEVVANYTKPIAFRVMATMFDIPIGMESEFIEWTSKMDGKSGTKKNGAEDQKNAQLGLINFFVTQIEDRKNNPRKNDLITYLMNSEVDGKKVPIDFVFGACITLLIAGIESIWSVIASTLWHLAQHPEHRQQLRDNPDLWPTALEELLRVYAPATMARVVNSDTEFQGCPMKAGDRVLLSFSAANRDPHQFENPDEVILDRKDNRHLAFGSGIHRCVGSGLGRLEVRVALQTWLERIPEFELVDPASVTWEGGNIRGVSRCLIKF